MKYASLLLAAIAVAALPTLVFAGPVGHACARSDRQAANSRVCNCIDQVAAQTLSRADQRQAARFFRNPDEAQQVRMHKSAAANAFWARYKNFVAQAQAYCR